MIEEGMRLSKKYGPAATIKVPMTKDGLDACAELSRQLIRVNVTLIFCIPQAILAAKAGATYVSPSWAGLRPIRCRAGSRTWYRWLVCTERHTRVLAASIRAFTELFARYNGAHGDHATLCIYACGITS